MAIKNQESSVCDITPMTAQIQMDAIASEISQAVTANQNNQLEYLSIILKKESLCDDDVKQVLGVLSNDLSEEITEPKYLLSFNGVGTMPRGDIQAIKGLAKHGKSYLTSILMASILGCKDFGFEATEHGTTVIYFDTEQNKNNTIKLIRRTHTLLGWNDRQSSPRLTNLSLRTITTQERVKVIEAVTRYLKPSAIFIDGIADLIDDFNEVKPSQRIVLQLMKLSTDVGCAIVNVLHTARTNTEGGMKGHLGSILLQKVSDEYEVKKGADNVFMVSETSSRNNAPIEDFSFTIADKGIPIRADEYVSQKIAEKEQAKADARKAKFTEIVKRAFKNRHEYSYTSLCASIMSLEGVTDRTAKRYISDMREFNLIDGETTITSIVQ